MGSFNELTLEDMYLMHEAVGMTFIVEDGQIKCAYVPTVQ
jgi:hypothetical protein